MQCELCNFYGYKLSEVRALNHKDFTMLFYGMQRIESKNYLKSFNVSSFPTMKSEDRNKLHREIFKVAYPEHFIKRAVKTDDLVLM